MTQKTAVPASRESKPGKLSVLRFGCRLPFWSLRRYGVSTGPVACVQLSARDRDRSVMTMLSPPCCLALHVVSNPQRRGWTVETSKMSWTRSWDILFESDNISAAATFDIGSLFFDMDTYDTYVTYTILLYIYTHTHIYICTHAYISYTISMRYYEIGMMWQFMEIAWTTERLEQSQGGGRLTQGVWPCFVDRSPFFTA